MKIHILNKGPSELVGVLCLCDVNLFAPLAVSSKGVDVLQLVGVFFQDGRKNKLQDR